MKLLELRLKNKLSQTEIANKLGLTQEKYSRLETKITKIDSNTLIKLADFYNVSLDYLCERQYNNQVGYIPDNRKNDIKKILELNDSEFSNTMAYVSAIIDLKRKS